MCWCVLHVHKDCEHVSWLRGGRRLQQCSGVYVCVFTLLLIVLSEVCTYPGFKVEE